MFKLAPLGHDPLFDITAPNLCEPSISDVVLRQNYLSSKPSSEESRGLCVMAAPSPPRPFTTWQVGPSLRLSYLVVFSNCDPSLQRDGFSVRVKTDPETTFEAPHCQRKECQSCVPRVTREETLSIPRRIPLRH